MEQPPSPHPGSELGTQSKSPSDSPADGNHKRIVQRGYDQIASRYLEWSSASPARMGYLQKLLDRLPSPATVLELGCGSGRPCTQILLQHAQVVANDFSEAQIALAKRFVPEAKLIHKDMTLLDFPHRSFDAVVAFYSIIHLPRAEQGAFITRLSTWIKPGGHLLVNLGANDDPGSVEKDWLGAEMYWSSYKNDKYFQILRDADLDILAAEVLSDDEDGKQVPFLWILARKRS